MSSSSRFDGGAERPVPGSGGTDSGSPSAGGPSITRVRKRDGREVPFDRAKIAAAIAKAMAAAGEEDLGFAAEVAGVVEIALARRAEARGRGDEAEGDAGARALAADGRFLPGIELIQDLVEQALVELGRAKVAKAYILYRDKRARIREALSVHEAAPGVTGGPGFDVRVQESQGSNAWSKGRIVAALLEEAGLPRASADEVAARVERRVFASGLRRITTGLVRELVNGELIDMGLTGALRRQESVGVPRHDLRAALAGNPFEEWQRGIAAETVGAGRAARAERGAVSLIGGEVLRRYALRDVVGDELAEMHLSGDLSIENLSAPHLPLTLSVPAELLAPGEPSSAAAFALLDAAAALARRTSHTLVLDDPGPALQPLARATRAKSPVGLAAWLAALVAVARASGRRIELGSPGARFSAFSARLVDELDELGADALARGLVRVYLEDSELDALCEDAARAAAVERLLAQGVAVPCWSRGEERFAGPGCRRRTRERTAVACGGAVALNVARLARRAGPWREDLVMEGLGDLVRCALDAAGRLAAFQREIDASLPGAPPLRARTGFALTLVGLREAVRHLGGGELDPALAARLRGFCGEAARRFAEGGAELALSAAFGSRAAARSAWLDAAGRHPMLFPGAGGPERHVAYSAGLALTPVPGWWPGEAEGELARVGGADAMSFQGIARGIELRAGAAASGAGEHPHRVAWSRFRARRDAVAGTAGDAGEKDVLFPVETAAG